MRSIGKKNIKLVQSITKEEIKNGYENLEERVIEKLSSGLWDLWEGADSEIRRIIWDTRTEEIKKLL